MSLTLVINGHSRTFAEFDSSSTVLQFVEELGLKGDRVAIELNGEIVARTRWPLSGLRQGDRLEVVHFVGGGCDLAAKLSC